MSETVDNHFVTVALRKHVNSRLWSFFCQEKKVFLYVQLVSWPADMNAEIRFYSSSKRWFIRKRVLVRFWKFMPEKIWGLITALRTIDKCSLIKTVSRYISEPYHTTDNLTFLTWNLCVVRDTHTTIGIVSSSNDSSTRCSVTETVYKKILVSNWKDTFACIRTASSVSFTDKWIQNTSGKSLSFF